MEKEQLAVVRFFGTRNMRFSLELLDHLIPGLRMSYQSLFVGVDSPRNLYGMADSPQNLYGMADSHQNLYGMADSYQNLYAMVPSPYVMADPNRVQMLGYVLYQVL